MKWTSSDSSSPSSFIGVFFCPEYQPACLPIIQVLSNTKGLTKSFYMKTSLDSGPQQAVFSELIGLTSYWITELVINWRHILLRCYMAIQSLFYLGFNCTSCLPKPQQQLSILLSSCFHLFFFTEFVGKHLQPLKAFLVVSAPCHMLPIIHSDSRQNNMLNSQNRIPHFMSIFFHLKSILYISHQRHTC